MINKLYGFLIDGAVATDYYYRHTTRAAGYTLATGVLAPRTTDGAYVQYCADQLCVLCLAALPKELAALDPNNTYARPSSAVEVPITEITAVPDSITVTIHDTAVAYPWTARTIQVVSDGIDTLTLDGNVRIPWGPEGTGVFAYGDFRLAFTGSIVAFTGKISLQRTPTRDLLELVAAIDKHHDTPWSETFEPYRDATVPTVRIAAFTLNALAAAE